MEMKFGDIQKGKKPLYTVVYDQLFQQIMNGTFPVDTKLPAEPELAKLLGVSRMTLRQALALLQDDGLIKSVHGKGNFVTRSQNKKTAIGLEKIGNPMYKCHTEKIDSVEMTLRLDLESEYTQQVLGRKAAAVVAFERWYKSKDQAVAYSFTYMAIETVSEMGLDLQDEKRLLDMLEKEVYELAASTVTEVKRSMAIHSSTEKYQIVGAEECDLLLESVYINESYPVVYNKYYIPKEYSQIRIVASK
ncbi:GntR family transcriptional regulator [Bacillus sp. FJAT-27231]|uniref:GntR family transcriptional regulator n=1 Tax=Bacillus sp. FJAT-27231 TaxID=1679168 RepID=UPI000671052F|nr:GntR family transcriptional regulator [Bacillus sp. FJAT-27231]KMY55838.1 GntR family transcriptional regulator [Bacillus sp. FJAT-27231]